MWLDRALAWCGRWGGGAGGWKSEQISDALDLELEMAVNAHMGAGDLGRKETESTFYFFNIVNISSKMSGQALLVQAKEKKLGTRSKK